MLPCHLYAWFHQRLILNCRHCPPHHAASKEVKHGGKRVPALLRGQRRHIRSPFRVRSIGGEVAWSPIGCHTCVRIAPGCHDRATRAASRNGEWMHQANDTFPSPRDALPSQLRRKTWTPLDLPVVLKRLLNTLSHFAIFSFASTQRPLVPGIQAAHPNFQHTAQRAHWVLMPMFLNTLQSHGSGREKMTTAFFKISRSFLVPSRSRHPLSELFQAVDADVHGPQMLLLRALPLAGTIASDCFQGYPHRLRSDLLIFHSFGRDGRLLV